MIKQLISIVIALMMMTTVCACGAGGKDSTGQAPEEKAVSETVSEEAQVTGEENTQVQESVEGGEEIVSNTSDSEQHQETTEAVSQEAASQETVKAVSQEAAPQETGEAASQEAAPQENVDIEDGGSGREMIQEDWDQLAAIGDVQVENGVMTVSLNVPADLAKNISQETIDAGIGTQYQAAFRNQDGSITYKMTKEQHQAMLEQLAVSFDNSLQEMIDDEKYTISNITRNNDFTVFDISLDGAEPSVSDSFAAFSLYMYGELYGVFNGNRPEHVIVNYLDSNGNLIDSDDSAAMNQQ